MLPERASNTRRKTDEARFFFERLCEHADIPVQEAVLQPPPPQVGYYLNAFISSARSVTWIMTHEYARCSGFEGWHDEWHRKARQPTLLSKTNTGRVRSQKIAPLVPTVRPQFISERILTPKALRKLKAVGVRATMTLLPKSGDAQRPLTPAWLERWDWIVEDFGDVEMLEFCSSYLMYVENLVNECERRFGHPHR